MPENIENAADLYADLRGAVISTVHDTMNKEIIGLRALVHHIVKEEIAACKKDIAREVMKEIAVQIRQNNGAAV